jgi:hypothetical protein
MQIKIRDHVITREKLENGDMLYCVSRHGLRTYHKYLSEASREVAEEQGHTEMYWVAGFVTAIEGIWLAEC